MDKYSFKITIGIFMLFRRSHETFLDVYCCCVYVLLYNILFYLLYMCQTLKILYMEYYGYFMWLRLRHYHPGYWKHTRTVKEGEIVKNELSKKHNKK